jgi:cytoskeletal protein CcmA (bactofilin family)
LNEGISGTRPPVTLEAMFEFLRRKNGPDPEPKGETKALPAAPAQSTEHDDKVLQGAVEAMLVDQAIPEPELDAEPEPEPEPQPVYGSINVIGSDTRIDGSLSTQTAIHLLGEIEGNVECVSLTLEQGARIRGDVTAAKSILVRGKIVGNLVVDGKLTVTDTGSVAGLVRARSMAIEEGAELLGHCSMASFAS